MPVSVASRRLSQPSLVARYGKSATFIDVTSRGTTPWVRFSPFFPHGGIPVPLSPGHTAASVEGIWQGLKVFENADVDLAVMQNTNMRGLKRTTARYGRVLGHRAGIEGNHLLAYVQARQMLYLPAYRWVLDHCLQTEIAELQRWQTTGRLVLLDYETNISVTDTSKPLSHAGLVALYLNNQWPSTSSNP